MVDEFTIPSKSLLTVAAGSRQIVPSSAGVGPDVPDRDDNTVGALFAAVRKRKWLVLAVTLIVIFATMALGLSQTKIYQATASLQIDPTPPRPLGGGVENVVDLGTRGYWATLEYYNTQHKIISSKAVALAAVNELGLHLDRAFLANRLELPEEKGKTATPEQAVGVLLGRLSVVPTKESRLVEISFEDADKDRAVRVLGAVIRSYVAFNVNRKIESTSSAVDWLGEQLVSLRSELEGSELALHEYKLEKEISSLGLDNQAGILAREMEQLTEARTKAQTKIQEAAARLAQLSTIKADTPESIPQMATLQSPELGLLRAEYLSSLRERNSLVEGGKGAHHPEVLRLDGRISVTKSSLESEIENIKEGATRELAALKQERDGLRSLLKTAEKKALDLNLMEIEYTRLRRTKDNNAKLYGLVLERTKEAGLTQMLRVNNIHVLSAPEAADAAVKPRLALILGVGGLAGLALGLAAAVLIARADRSIQTSAELEANLGLTPLGIVPDVGVQGPQAYGARRRRKARRGADPAIELMMHHDPSSGFSEAIRAIRTNLLFMSPDKPFKRLLITSASPSEGKTTVACCIGIAMAQAGHRVLLIDADMRRPRLQGIFQQESGHHSTLSEALLERERFQPELLPTEVPNLSVLKAGPSPPNPAELLHSESFHLLLDDISSHYDLIVIDSPPLVVTDAAIMSTHVDGTLLVVRAAQTERAAAQRAVRAIRGVGGHVVGGILNAMDFTKASYGYGKQYGYGQYGYGQYGNDGVDEKSPPAA